MLASALAAGAALGLAPPAEPSDAHPQPPASMSEDRHKYAGTSTTSSSEWSALPIRKGPCKGDVNACRYPAVRVNSNGQLTVVWRGTVSGASVELRLIDGAAASLPSPADVVIKPGRSAVTFVSTRERAHLCGEGLRMLWRSPSGKRAKISKTTTVVRYAPNPPSSTLRGCA